MLDPDGFRRLLNFFQEPVLIVRRSGQIETANAGARAVLGDALEGRHLGKFSTISSEALDSYLKRCGASGSPVVGSIVLRDDRGREKRFQIKGALLSKDEGGAGDRIILRCSANAFREFTYMSRQLDELNRENRRQRRERAILQEWVAQRDLLLRELQHRVRNQTQMLLGMIWAAQRRAEGEELSTFLDGLRARLQAMAAVQQLMYSSTRVDSLSARDLIDGLGRSIAETWPEDAELSVDSIDAELSNEVAVPVALIINELLCNALKHGLKHGPGKAAVSLQDDQDDLVLTVWDSGPGFEVDLDRNRPASGMALVRGLCRQIGGAFSVKGNQGTRCTVRFPRSLGERNSKGE